MQYISKMVRLYLGMQCFGRCGISKSCGTVECDSPSDVQGSRKEPKLDENNLFELITFDSYDK